MTLKTGIFVFRNDLRILDNPALEKTASACDQLLCIYIIDDAWFKINQFGSSHLGNHRQYFLYESLIALNASLNNRNQNLHIINGDFIQSIATLIDSLQPTVVGLNQDCGFYESVQAQQLQALCNDYSINYICSHEPSLLNTAKLPFALMDMPDVFSPFRRKVEKNDCLRHADTSDYEFPPRVETLNHQFDIERLANGYDEYQLSVSERRERMRGGEQSALAQLDYYLFETDLIADYKQTRNQLEGWDFSSKLSAWLANGSISAAVVADRVKQYEQSRVANDSTYWLIFELLWREFFHLQALKQGKLLFAYGGIQNKEPTTQFNSTAFQRWCDGETGFPIVDACMRQLNTTGFMSNRGRQLVASCFVHELNLDWRYGASYFEQQLVDYDVASNWGNWQYLAGVGTDPRGHRQFNLAKQTEIYDPQQTFIKSWLNAC